MFRKEIFLLMLTVVFALPVAAISADDIEQHRSCAQCGMDRKAYGFSRMLIQYEDGSAAGVCSLRCAVQEISYNVNRPVAKLFVADRTSRNLIEATMAVWVLGGNKPGVMTKVPKWAFGTPADAEAFVKSFGGKIVTWEEVLTAAKEEMANRQER
jgi:copper chaperone NosL